MTQPATLGIGKRTDWCTPAVVLDRVYRLGPIALDPCPNPTMTISDAIAALKAAKARQALAIVDAGQKRSALREAKRQDDQAHDELCEATTAVELAQKVLGDVAMESA